MNAQNWKDAIQDIFDKYGKVTPTLVIHAAMDQNSPLHDLFEWDDAKAGKEYRLIQARKLIREVKVKYEETEQRLVHVPKVITAQMQPGESREGEYKPVGAIIKQPSEFERAMASALRTLNAATDAVEELKAAAAETEDATIAKLALALEAIATARDAVRSLH